MEEEIENLEVAGIDDGDNEQPHEVPAPSNSKRKLYDWLEGYCEFTEDFEPPQVFNKWCGLVALAAVTGRKVWLAEANASIYPNLFVVFVAASGVGKTTAMREVKPFIEECQVPLSAGKPSAAKFITSFGLAQKHIETIGFVTNYLIWAEELPSFLGTDAYKSGMLADLTTLYDCPDQWSKETHVHQLEAITRAYLCMLGGTTAEGLFDVMPKGSITQGFTARLLFIHAMYNERRVVEKPWGAKQQQLIEPLKHDLKHIATLKGPVHFSDIARVMWADYYVYRPHASEEFTDTRLQGYAARKPFYVKKLALLQSVSEGDTLVVEAHHLEKAFKLIEEVDRTLTRVYSDIAPSVTIQSFGKIIDKLKRARNFQMTKTELQRNFAYMLNRVEFIEAMASLQDMDLVEQRFEEGKSTKKHVTVYTLTEGGKKWQK